jgi:hypothetical protein
MRRNILLVAVVACAGVSACSGRSDVQVLAGAARTMSDVETVHVDITIELDGPGVDTDVAIVTSADSTMDGREVDGTVDLAGEQMHFLLVDQAYYYEVDDLPDGKRWLRMSVAEATRFSGVDVAASQDLDLRESVVAFLEAADEVEELGRDTVAGADTTRYRVTVPVDEIPNADELLTDDGQTSLAGLVGDRLTYEVWLDDDGLARRLEYAIDLSGSPSPPPGMPASGTLTYEFELKDFGVPVAVESPPTGDVVDFSELGG